MNNNHASDWQPGTLKTPSEYSGRAFYALSRHFPITFWIPRQNEYYRGVQKVLARCTSSLDLHMLIVPFWYLFRTLLVPKVALGCNYLILRISIISDKVILSMNRFSKRMRKSTWLICIRFIVIAFGMKNIWHHLSKLCAGFDHRFWDLVYFGNMK